MELYVVLTPVSFDSTSSLVITVPAFPCDDEDAAACEFLIVPNSCTYTISVHVRTQFRSCTSASKDQQDPTIVRPITQGRYPKYYATRNMHSQGVEMST